MLILKSFITKVSKIQKYTDFVYNCNKTVEIMWIQWKSNEIKGTRIDYQKMHGQHSQMLILNNLFIKIAWKSQCISSKKKWNHTKSKDLLTSIRNRKKSNRFVQHHGPALPHDNSNYFFKKNVEKHKCNYSLQINIGSHTKSFEF